MSHCWYLPSLFETHLLNRSGLGPSLGPPDALVLLHDWQPKQERRVSIRDPFYSEILQALASISDTDRFEELAAELVQSKGYPANVVVGGSDDGYDFELLDEEGTSEPGPGVATTSDRVTTNLKKNLNRNAKNCPGAAKKTFVVTSAALTTKKRDNLKKAAQEHGYVLLGAADQQEIARYIYNNPHWAQELLGLAGQPSALSPVPRSSRPLLPLPLVGRDDILEKLETLETDASLFGHPGSGKTAVLSLLTDEDRAAFLASEDMTAVANAIRRQSPEIIVLDDLRDTVETTQDLTRLRQEIGVDFKIIATDWERNPAIEQMLGLEQDQVFELGQLTKDELVQVVNAVGVGGPTDLVRVIVDQANGVPGLAVTLAQTALAGHLEGLLTGERLGTLMEATLRRLFGNDPGREQLIPILGTIALGGNLGLTVEEIATATQIASVEVVGLLRRLAPAGVLRPKGSRITVRPPAFRGFLICEAFFGQVPLDWRPILSLSPSPGEVTKELVLAERAGAVVPDLLDTVLSHGSTEAARYFAGSSREAATRLLAASPGLAVQVAYEALSTAPEVVLPLLLQEAIGDKRELHNTTEHPLRKISDWANGGMPGTGEAIGRKRITVRRALKWIEEEGDAQTGLRAAAIALRTVSESHELDPGAGKRMSLFRQMLTEEEIEAVGDLWSELRDALSTTQEIPWQQLTSLAWGLLFPKPFGPTPSQGREASRRLGERVLQDLGNIATGHPAVLDRLNAMRRQLDREEVYELPEDYAALHAEYQWDDWQRGHQERLGVIHELADKWANKEPAEFAARMRWLHEEANLLGRMGVNFAPALCTAIAKKVGNPANWVQALESDGVSPDCLLPFLNRAAEQDPENWEELACDALRHPALTSAGVMLALRRDTISDVLWEESEPFLPQYSGLIEILCLRNEVAPDTLRRLLKHPSSEVAEKAAVGMWVAEPHGEVPDDLQEEWDMAVVRIQSDQYWLGEMLRKDGEVAEQWLRAHIAENNWHALRNQQNISMAAGVLSIGQRKALLRAAASGGYQADLATVLIGDSKQLYREVLREEDLRKFCAYPLKREADDTWRQFARIALDEGLSPAEVGRVSTIRYGSYYGPESAHLGGLIKEFRPWLEDPDEEIQQTARAAIERLEYERRRAIREERREEIEGW